MSPQAFFPGPFFDFAARRMVESMTDLRGHSLCIDGGRGLYWRFTAHVVTVPSESLLCGVAQVFCMELRVGLVPLLGRTVLVFLKVCDEIIEDIREVIFESIVTDETFGPDKEARAPLGNEGNIDGSINEPCREKSIQFVECVLEFRTSMEELGFTTIEGLDNALNVLLNIAVPESLIAVQFWKLVDIKGAICDILHRALGHPVPTRENILRELQGL